MIVKNKITNKLYGVVDELKFLTTPSSHTYEAYNKSDLVPLIKVNESEADELEKYIVSCLKEGKSFEQIYEAVTLHEGVFGQILGGLTGFALGKKIGGYICKCLGIGEGILKDLLTSRLFGASLGAAIGNNV